MTIFQLVKIALDALYAEATSAYGSSADSKISEQIGYLSTSYNDLNKVGRTPVDYKDPATRFAYVYKYVASHGNYVVQVLDALRQELKEPIFKSSSIRVSCIGGGPGSDIIALLKYLDERKATEKVTKVTCYLLDREQAWADTWTELDDSLQTDLLLHANFQPLDVTKPASWAQQKKFLQADLFTMSYFVSEVKALDSNGVVSRFWQTLFQEAKPGALFLYDDNGHDAFNSYFDGQWKQAGLTCIIASTNQMTYPSGSEQKGVLGSYLTKFGQSPKLKTPLSYRVLRKP
jgi:Putative SAM-dependent methyltransferase